MKTRSGFVSNSSTSSFIVRVKDIFSVKSKGKGNRIISKEQESLLLGYGFKSNPYRDTLEKEILCNQDIVMTFLVKNKIPFTADINYECQSVVYDGGDKIVFGTNFGKSISMYHYDSVKDAVSSFSSEKPLEIIAVDDYIKSNEEFANA